MGTEGAGNDIRIPSGKLNVTENDLKMANSLRILLLREKAENGSFIMAWQYLRRFIIRISFVYVSYICQVPGNFKAAG